MSDPDWYNGDYSAHNAFPSYGPAVARMIAHVTYMSEQALHHKFGRELQDKEEFAYGFDADFQIESYLRYQGTSFVDRFDANSYLYITKAMDYFDLAMEYGGNLSDAFKDVSSRICIISFTSDWLFPTEESRKIVRALNASDAKVSFVEIESSRGHDSFLLDETEFQETVKGFLG
jgi:homoserine O-acetyltransferase